MSIIRFWKSYICSNKLDCVRNRLPFLTTQTVLDRIDLRLDGMFALELWDLKLYLFLEEIYRISDRYRKSHKIDAMKDIDSVLSNVQSARQEALMCVFEYKEVVIEMILKGRSPIMRHASRNHRVVLDWLFDRII